MRGARRRQRPVDGSDRGGSRSDTINAILASYVGENTRTNAGGGEFRRTATAFLRGSCDVEVPAQGF